MTESHAMDIQCPRRVSDFIAFDVEFNLHKQQQQSSNMKNNFQLFIPSISRSLFNVISILCSNLIKVMYSLNGSI